MPDLCTCVYLLAKIQLQMIVELPTIYDTLRSTLILQLLEETQKKCNAQSAYYVCIRINQLGTNTHSRAAYAFSVCCATNGENKDDKFKRNRNTF